MKHVLHVHQQLMRKGEPALIDRTYRGSKHYTRIEISGPCVLIQSDTPDACGARVWLETESDIMGTCD